MDFNIFNSIILAGIIQGLIFTVIVVSSKKYRSRTTLLLAALILQFSLNNLQFYLADSEIISYNELYNSIYIPYQYISGPLILFYGLALLYPEKKFSIGAKLTLIPFAIGLMTSLIYKICVAVGYDNEAVMEIFRMGPDIDEFFSIIFDIIIVVYLYTTIVKKQIENREFTISKVHLGLGWFKIILTCFFFLAFLWLYCAIMDIFNDVDLYYALWISMSIMIYWLGHIGIYKFGINEERKKIRSFSIDKETTYVAGKQKNEHIISMEKLVVGSKKFLDPTLTLDAIAEELNLSKSHLSRIINNEMGMGFPDYINSLRVEEAKSYLSNSDFSNYTLVAIGLEAGFNSKTTFNTAFKKVTSLTPSQFRNQTAIK